MTPSLSSAQNPTRGKMLPIIAASTIGTLIEWYDFTLYGFLAATVFGQVFFPSLDVLTGTIAAFSTYYAGFISRPIGGALFGWLGDRFGRKSTLVATLLITGAATVLIGLLPTTAQIGIAAPLLVTTLRFLQGVGAGGEWAGAVLLPLENSSQRHRGFWASWPQVGQTLGAALAIIALTLTQHFFPGQSFSTIGWRIPFLVSIVLIVIGLVIRARILDTPIFVNLKQKNQLAAAPLLSAVKHSWREIILITFVRAGEQIPAYLFSTFLLSYGVLSLGLKPTLLYAGLLAAAVINCLFIPLASHFSDNIGRKRWYLVGLLLMAAFAFPFFLVLQTRQPLLVVLDIVIAGGVLLAWLYGPEAALITERFDAKERYSGSSLGYQIGGVVMAGPAPIIATFLVATFHSSVAVALYIILAATAAFLATWQLKEYANKNARGSTDTAATDEEDVALSIPPS